MTRDVYECLVAAVKGGRLQEPFDKDDFMEVCPDFDIGDLFARVDFSDIVKRVAPGKFQLVRPFKFGLDG